MRNERGCGRLRRSSGCLQVNEVLLIIDCEHVACPLTRHRLQLHADPKAMILRRVPEPIDLGARPGRRILPGLHERHMPQGVRLFDTLFVRQFISE